MDRSTLAGWVGKSTGLLEPLANAIKRYVLSCQAIFADDTPVKMLPPGNGKKKRQRASGHMTEMNARGEAMRHQRQGISSHKTAKAYAPANISKNIRV